MRTDIRFSKAAIFVGYSLADLDITRLISTDPAYSAKCVFIVSDRPSARDAFRLPHYGTMLARGIEDAAGILEDLDARFAAPQRIPMFYSFEERTIHTPPEPPNDDARFDLLLRGSLHLPMLTSSIADFKTSPYVLPRDALESCLQQLRDGTPLQVLHSNLGNGKSVLSEALCVRATEMGWKCFKLDREQPRLSEEIDYLQRLHEKTLLVIEHYPTHFDMLRELFAVRNTNVSVVLTARTPAHEIFADRLAAVTSEWAIVEHDLNRLSDKEVQSLNYLLEASGYWRTATPTRAGDRNRIIRRKYHRELQAVLLDLIESPAIRDRIQVAYDELCKTPDLETFVVTGFILDGIGFGKDSFLLGELVDRPTALPELIRRTAVAKEFVTYRDGEFVSRSPILARFVLTSLETSGSVEAALLELFRKASSRRTANREIDSLSIQLMQYSQIEGLFPRRRKTERLSNYDEGIKNLIPSGRRHHYWLQYAISRIATEITRKQRFFWIARTT